MMETEIRVGVAQKVITPPTGVSLAGYFHDRIGETVRDDLHARCVVIESGGERIALVACDLISIHGSITEAARGFIEKEAGIRPECVMVSSTHTHTGPEIRPNRVVPRHAEWADSLPRMIADAVRDAADNMFDASLHPGRGEEHDLAHIRLFRMRDGTEKFGPGSDLSKVAGVAGEIDPELVAMKIVDGEGTVRAVLVNYALHVDVIGGGGADFISADWPGEMARAVAGIYGDQCITLFLNGCCGDINQHPYLKETKLKRRGPEGAILLGRAFGGLAVNAAEKGEPVTEGKVEAMLDTLQIPYYEVDDKMRAHAAELGKKDKPSDFEKFIIKQVETWDFAGKTEPVPVHAMRVGNCAFVGLPGEIFVHWGREIKKWSPAEFTFVVELANHWVGYVPTIEQAVRGGYGAMPILSRRLTVDAGQQMADAAFVMLQKLWE
ncbi:MAG: hypothetical protein GXP25_06960 [Planctomycetes bacterium]|nr:hypothetical protein [Planctomycetota bacterium]